ncbi:MAG: SLBB domain-containing protein [Chitinophagaceae bacterium]|nr:SLBB domain-containing protein [Chitinophagaceae bacterium]
MSVKSFLPVWVVVLFWVTMISPVLAQDLLKMENLKNVKVEQLGDADILRLIQQLEAASMSVAQAEQMAAAKGMSPDEIEKLRVRIQALQKKGATSTTVSAGKEVAASQYTSAPKAASQNLVFGAQLFNSTSLSFEPNLRIATPGDYQIGPDDELQLNLFGVQEANFRLPVAAEGMISIPNVGMVLVAGLTIDEAQRVIRQKLIQTVYRSLANGATAMTLTLGKIRSIRITILGATKPGNYTVSSLTTLFNALYICGGPGDIGSYREIELVRNNKTFLKVDLYDFLVKGDAQKNVLLKEGDVINIPVYKTRVLAQGEIKRPGIYEMREGEVMDDLIKYAGGFSEKAYRASVKISRLTDKERVIIDLSKDAFKAHALLPGDSIHVEPILNRYANSVFITGAVFRPGTYEFQSNMTITQLIQKADGLKEDVYTGRVLLSRERNDLSKEMVSIPLAQILKGEVADVILQKNDSIRIASIYDLKDQATITVQGEVRKPLSVAYKANYSLKDLIFEAGGFTSAAMPYRIEISRRVTVSATTEPSLTDKTAEIITLQSELDLASTSKNFLLQPYDVVTVRRNPGYVEQQEVQITGEVVFPGMYTLENKQENIYDIFKRVGGLTPKGDPNAVTLIRKEPGPKTQRRNKEKVLINENIDSSLVEMNMMDVMDSTVRIAIDLEEITKNPNSANNMILRPGDIIEVGAKETLVKISGEVYFPTKVTHVSGANIRYYLSRAGGLTEQAHRKHLYVVYPNGSVAKSHSYFFGLIRTYPNITTGADIVIPPKTVKKKPSTVEIISLSGILVSLSGMAIALINSLK